jgi:predicted nucleic acid-binding protein
MMKKKFPGYYRPSNEEFNRIWKQALFVFDTNVLLDLYRLSERSSNELFNVLNAIRENIWIPYQVSKEYHKNLNEVIKGQAEKYSDSLKQLEKFKNVIEEKRNHPFLEDEMLNEFTTLCSRIEDTLSKKGEKVRNLII